MRTFRKEGSRRSVQTTTRCRRSKSVTPGVAWYHPAGQAHLAVPESSVSVGRAFGQTSPRQRTLPVGTPTITYATDVPLNPATTYGARGQFVSPRGQAPGRCQGPLVNYAPPKEKLAQVARVPHGCSDHLFGRRRVLHQASTRAQFPSRGRHGPLCSLSHAAFLGSSKRTL